MPANDNREVLERRLGWWKVATGGMTALAAALGVLLLARPAEVIVREPAQGPAAPVVAASAPPMVAMIGEDQKDMKVVANWDPVNRRLVLAVAGDMPGAHDKSHELWVIPAGGIPRSLGTMPAGKRMHMDLAETIAELLRQGSTIAISVEPSGGSPTGAPTGPVIASGALEPA